MSAIESSSDDEAPRYRGCDLRLGTVWSLGTFSVSREDIVAFGEQWDPLPIHIDRRAASEGPFGELIASGIHKMAIMQRLSAEGVWRQSTLKVGRGLTSVFLGKPLRADVSVRGTVEVVGVEYRERGDYLVSTRSTLHDPDGELILEMVGEAIWV